MSFDFKKREWLEQISMRKTLEREVTDALQRQGSSLMETLCLGSNHRRSKREFLKNVERETRNKKNSVFVEWVGVGPGLMGERPGTVLVLGWAEAVGQPRPDTQP